MQGNRRFGVGVLVALLAVLAAVAGPVEATGAHRGGGHDGRLRIGIDKAPVAPDGTTAGAVTDIVVSFADTDPDVPGIALRAGGTISVHLPPEVVDTGTQPFANFATPGCAPPLVEGCNTALVLQGWPQSPRPPFPMVTWEPSTSTITATMAADWLPAGPGAPGPKQLHLLLLGFRNPDRAGRYPVQVEIRPDPTDTQVLRGTGHLRIRHKSRPSVEVLSTINGAPPPPFPNSVYQQLELGEQPLRYGWYLWDADGLPLEGATLRMINAKRGLILDGAGSPIGSVRIRAPRHARGVELVATGPATATPAFITGVPAALLQADLHVDPSTPGHYRVVVRLWRGARQTMSVEVLADSSASASASTVGSQP